MAIPSSVANTDWQTSRQAAPATPQARLLATLADVNLVLSKGQSPRLALEKALALLTPLYGVLRASVVLRNPETGRLAVEASAGLSSKGRRARWDPGEGVTGRVVKSGRPVVVPQITREPLFLDRTGPRSTNARSETTFISVPIPGERRAMGALNLDLAFEKDRDYERDLQLFRVVATLVAQAVRVTQLVEPERRRLRDENLHLKEELRERYAFSQIIGSSGPMRAVFEQVERVAANNTTVLIRGESGTGKGLIAHAIHYNSLRAKRPFVKVSCAALPESLIESELFGYERGAFTGATTRKKGRFELAEGGTLFLDEIGDIDAATQVKLLRVLQEREYERVGGTQTLKTDVRLVAATNVDLEKALAAGTFREDLNYRINVFTIFIPPLRERKTDILLLADRFLHTYALEHRKNISRLSTAAIDMLMSYHWPGNVRELENAIERAVLVCDDSAIQPHHLPPTLQTAEASDTGPGVSLAEAVGAYERDLIHDALKATRGNRVKAARVLSTTERVISYKAKKYGIDCDGLR